jgi:hypothetical protein
VWKSTEKEFQMNDYSLSQLARERQAGFRLEAEMNRMARKAETGRPIATKWKLSLVTALVTATIILLDFLG